jgi:tRNA (guanine37-N1)-methyltransferase
MLQFDLLTIFPKMFDGYFDESIIKRAKKNKLVQIKVHDLRRWTNDKHKTVDDRPYGGGPGMILKTEPIYRALKNIIPEHPKLGLKKKSKIQNLKSKIIMLDPAGKQFDQPMAEKFAKLKRIVLLCGRYEGFDHRVTKFADEKISIGNYVLTGGEVPAMVLVDAITRLVPGVVGKKESLLEETFVRKGYIEYPQYTRPEDFMGLKVPKILLSGDHGAIVKWRQKHTK